jgi:serine/threonine protein kinase/tetratricopeptide (TPR) repeat protein
MCGTQVQSVYMTDVPEDGADASSDVDLTQAASANAKPSMSIGPYRLLERIGEGGMGEVWLAEQARPVQRQVALKLIKAGMDTAQVIARFDAERQALALMDHPAIARVFDGGATPQGRPYFVMEFVRGEPISAYATRHKLPLRERIELFIQVCEGVQHAHQKGIIHRDLKPSNVLVTVRDDHPAPKIIDFGVAKAMTQSLTERTLHTEIGALVGTPEYMSPEQAEMGGLDIDTRTDVYALGVILYELLTDTLPFDPKSLREKSLDEIRRVIREVDPPRPSTRVAALAATRSAGNPSADATRLGSQLCGDLDWITMKALEKDRTRRYGSVSDLAADLRRHLDDLPVLASPPSATYRVGKFVRRHRTGVVATGGLISLLIVFAVVMAVQAGRIARERDRANQEAASATQVLEFLVGLFNVSDPGEARGNSLTAREILDKGAQGIDGKLDAHPQNQARLQETIGKVYSHLGLYGAAEPLFKRALQTNRRLRGEDSPETLRAAAGLAETYFRQGRYSEAQALFLDLTQRYTRVLGEEHAETLDTAINLAIVYLYQERWDDAGRILRRAMESSLRAFGEQHLTTLNALHNLGSLYWRQGRYAESLPFTARAVDGRSRLLGADHPETLASMHNLATTYDRLSRYDDAERVYLSTIEAKRRVLGEAHDSTIITRRRLASMYERQHRYSDAEAQLLAAAGALAESRSADQEALRNTVAQLVGVYELQHKASEAAEWRAKLPKGGPPQP